MSSTKRGRERNRKDNYPTPKWCVKRLLEEIGAELPEGMWCEPCAGDGAIIMAVNEALPGARLRWTAIEIRAEGVAKLKKLPMKLLVLHDNTLKIMKRVGPWEVIISNPPFSQAMEIIVEAMQHAKHVIMLLRLNFLGSEERAEFMRRTQPDIYVLPNRPSFFKKRVRNKKTGEISKTLRDVTDSIEYAWFHWWGGSSGRIRVLRSTPKIERLTGRRRQAS